MGFLSFADDNIFDFLTVDCQSFLLVFLYHIFSVVLHVSIRIYKDREKKPIDGPVEQANILKTGEET